MSRAQGIRIPFATQSGTPSISAGLKTESQASFKIGTHRSRSEQTRRIGGLLRHPLFAT